MTQRQRKLQAVQFFPRLACCHVDRPLPRHLIQEKNSTGLQTTSRQRPAKWVAQRQRRLQGVQFFPRLAWADLFRVYPLRRGCLLSGPLLTRNRGTRERVTAASRTLRRASAQWLHSHLNSQSSSQPIRLRHLHGHVLTPRRYS